MSNKVKYINFEHIGLVMFEGTIDHSSMAKNIGFKVLSAGFVNLPFEDSLGNKPTCFGKSVSLNVESSPKDTEILQRLLNPYGW